MAVDPKLAAGGVATVIIGGGTGYAITKTVSESKEETNQAPSEQPSPNKGSSEVVLTEEQKTSNKTKNKAALTAAGFQVESNKEAETNCKTKLEEKTLSSENDFKEAVKACIVGKKFSDKAGQMGLDVLSDSNKSTWESWWNSKKTSIKPLVSELSSSSSKDTWSDAQTDLVNFCTQDSKGNKVIDENSKSNDWTNFLTACTKDKTVTGGTSVTVNDVKTKNFWTGATPASGGAA